MFTCNQCGSNMRFNPQTQKLECPSCGLSISAAEYQNMKKTAKEMPDAEWFRNQPKEVQENYTRIFKSPDELTEENSWVSKLYVCPNCGGQLLAGEDTAATFCSFCGSSVMLEQSLSRNKKPDLIIPFSKTKDECEKEYKKYIKKAPFVPNDMKSDEKISKFRGIYMPYFSYSFSKHGDMTLNGTKSKRSGDYIYTDHYAVDLDADIEIEDISYDASSAFSDRLSQGITPFNKKEVKNFSPGYISGFYADMNDLEENVYNSYAKSEASGKVAENLLSDKKLSKYNIENPEDKVNLNKDKTVLSFYPVWFLASQNKSKDRVTYAAVNGQTGKVSADLPIDKKKLIIGTLLLMIPAFLLLNLCFTITPFTTLVLSVLFGIAGLIIANWQLNKVYIAENRLDDIGYMAKHNIRCQTSKKEKTANKGKMIAYTAVFLFLLLLCAATESEGFMSLLILGYIFLMIHPNTLKKKKTITLDIPPAPFKEKIPYFIKPAAGILVAVTIGAINPVMDEFYYAGCAISLICMAWTFLDIIGLHNRIAQRPIPQFDKREGENYEA